MMFTKLVFMIVAIPFCYFGLVNAIKTSKRQSFKFKEISLSLGRSNIRKSSTYFNIPLIGVTASIKETMMSNGIKSNGWIFLKKDILKHRSDNKFLLDGIFKFVLASKQIFRTPAATGRGIICLHDQHC